MTDTDVRRIEDKVDNVALVLAELKGSLAPTLDKLTEGQDDLEKRLEVLETTKVEDHEKRIRTLERFRYSVPSLSLLSVIVSVGVLIYYLTGGH